MSLVHQNHDAFAWIDIRGDVIELVDHGDDKPAIIATEDVPKVFLVVRQFIVLDAISLDVFYKLPFEFVAVDEHQHRRFLRATNLAEQLGGDSQHGEGLATSLRVPNESTALRRISDSLDDLLNSTGLVLTKNLLREFVVLSHENDVVANQPEEARAVEERFDLALVVAGLLVAPVE